MAENKQNSFVDETKESNSWEDILYSQCSQGADEQMTGMTRLYSLISRQHSESVSQALKQSIALHEQNADAIQEQVNDLRAKFGDYKGKYVKLQQTAEELAVELERTHLDMHSAIRLLRLNGIRIPDKLSAYC